MEILSIPRHRIFVFFGDRVEMLEDEVGGGSGEVKGSAPALPLFY